MGLLMKTVQIVSQTALPLVLNVLLKLKTYSRQTPGELNPAFPFPLEPSLQAAGEHCQLIMALFNASVISHSPQEATLGSSSGVPADALGLHTCCDGRHKRELIKSIVQTICFSPRLTHLKAFQQDFIASMPSLWCDYSLFRNTFYF